MFIQRDLTSKLIELSKQFPAVFLTGPRQSGKSTLLRREFPHYRYVNLEDRDVREFALDDPRGFLSEHSGGLIIDEAQHAPDLFSYLQQRIDDLDCPGAYLLSGSQNFLMLRNISQSLAGRVGVLSLLPFTLKELARAKKMPTTSEQWILAGSYPRVIAQGVFPENFYPSYLQTYVQRDVRLESGVRDLTRFETFLTACAAKVGSLINFTDLGRDVGVDARTISTWLSIL